MAIRVNPKLINTLEKYGAEDVQKCYHCGNCSAVCAHADDLFVFPRRPMRLLQMGLEKRIESSLDPWLCYYCGQCSTQCPRGAEPGETMMSLRRWLTARYDLTGISRLFYQSWKAELAGIVILAVLTAAGFLVYGFTYGDINTYDGPAAFMPSSVVHVFDWAMAFALALLLAMNAVRMWWLTTGRRKELKIPLRTYITGLFTLPLHFFTQKAYARCANRRPWVLHLCLMLSYVVMLVLIMFFLAPMQEGPAIRWDVHVLGYASALGLFVTVSYAVYGRVKKTEVHLRHSHESDWIFLAMLLLVTVTGILQHVLHRAGTGMAANIAYVVHLALVVPMLVLEVPFSKWSHLAYRPLAIYLAQVHRAATPRRESTAPGAQSMKMAS